MISVERSVTTTRIVTPVRLAVRSNERGQVGVAIAHDRGAVTDVGVYISEVGGREHFVSGFEPVRESRLTPVHLGFPARHVGLASGYIGLSLCYVALSTSGALTHLGIVPAP